MLEKILSEIRSGGTFEVHELAVRLGTTPELLEAMLEHLQREGLIQPYLACSDACGGCSLQNGCAHAGDGQASKQGLILFKSISRQT